jgi:hypothetical protein
MQDIEYPSKAPVSNGELEMGDASSNLVQKQWSELAQQVVHIVLACNEETDVLEAEFDSFEPILRFWNPGYRPTNKESIRMYLE